MGKPVNVTGINSLLTCDFISRILFFAIMPESCIKQQLHTEYRYAEASTFFHKAYNKL